MALSDKQVKATAAREKPYKLSDSGGLYVDVRPTGAKYWRLKYRFAGKEKLLALGVYPIVSLKEAREKTQAAKSVLDAGQDPGELKKSQKNNLQMRLADTFESIALAWFEVARQDWSVTHTERTQNLLKNHLFPWLGSRPIGDITPPELLQVLYRAQDRGLLETAKRAKQTASQVFRYAIRNGKLMSDPSRDLAGALRPPKTKHFAAITDPAGVADLMRAIDCYQGTPAVKTALLLSAMLFQRPGEMRTMKWKQLDWDKAEWRYTVTKTNIEHIVPLPTQAIDTLRALEPFTARSSYVFPSARSATRPMSENGVRVALRTMGYTNDQMTAHGFRAMARTLLDEELGFPPEWIEHQLAHAVKDPLGRAYNRTKHLPQRKEMMQKWADYLVGFTL
ncbi:integrase arm-type DNA-binding domain-containing protein [Aestuariicella hydrocarbonica]|uniref:Integrase arm-type DNA-binding domain-containing protein n=1 Tax=Pseudomaricurvus hydrocarbonicus TaxID=1470433 RepID=A0A9E5MP01_9GAMM|nr:integrase arm-type DNA-binding domain-containing protein [Aestuariicella hydrocarbonica]NHO67694.1 integrase arm-type DNA-binding domain-containing protein [Aestuariicella hydrocarbonica]